MNYLIIAIRVLTIVSAFFLTSGAAAAQPSAEKVPVSVRRLLKDVGHLIDEKSYDAAVKKILAFQAKGDPADMDDIHHHAMVYFALGNCRLLSAQYDQAEKDYAEALRRQPHMAPAWINRAKVCCELNRHETAAQYFMQAYESAEQKQPEHLYYAAAALLVARKYAQSIATFEKLISAHPDAIQPAWQAHRAHALIAGGRQRRALPVIKKLITLLSGEERMRWQETLVYQYIQLSMLSEAAAYAQSLAHETPESPRWWKLLSQARLNLGEYSQALAALTIYGFLTPLNRQEKQLWADLNLQLGIPSQAAPVYKNLLAASPDPHLLKNIAMAYRRMGDPKGALTQLERYAKKDKDPELLMLRADLLYETKQFSAAAHAYRLAAAQSRTDRSGQAWLMAGYAAWQDNDIDAGRSAFAKASRYKRHRKTALLAMEQMERINQYQVIP